MLPYYAERFPTVEINYTFYRAPNEKILDGWSAATPERFKLTLKAPKRITHDARLRDCGDRVRQFLETAATLGPKLGALLFQLPPNLKKDLRALRRVPGRRFRRGCARRSSSATPRGSTTRSTRGCGAQPGAVRRRQREALDAGRDHGADYGYFRLRDEGYTPEDIARWADVIASGRAQLRGRLRLLQARRGREGAGVRAGC